MKSYSKYCLRFLLTYFVLICGIISVNGQNEISYSYDANGNRISRSILLRKSAIVEDSVYKEETEKEIFKDEIGEIQIRIYPNPTKGNLIVEVSGASIGAEIDYSVYSSKGTSLMRQKFFDNNASIDFTNQPSGIYILKLNIEGKKSEWKIIKE